MHHIQTINMEQLRNASTIIRSYERISSYD